ncbi:hypothetical protein [Shewanella saliphila]|uniref:Lipoprotein n=1 Tax=Shewanella saliphila TaxID=2282698 RepID=A0ABQ2Q5A7_9GAMM|nr:hypothetical protein [Shewanella saliphila]MCL1101532.1 hypothetical protein [Shewanella saliphila]GGP50509.1 hypothetical protein GCM10009409_16090 [Shewanella saliphila]
MNKTIVASLIIPVLLSGCGSSSSSSSTPVNYTWQIVQLVSIDEETAVDDGCAIYANSTVNDDEVITAVVATDDYNILYHNSDGSIFESFSSAEFSDGEVVINANDVPDDGFVSLEEVDGSLSTYADVYMFSVGKSLLSDLVVNVRQTQSTSNSCYSVDGNDDYRDDAANDYATISINQPSSTVNYYQTSYDIDSVTGQDFSSRIPVISPLSTTRDLLVTAFDDYDDATGEKNLLSYYNFLDSSFIYEYDVENNIDDYETSGDLINDDLVYLNWSIENYAGTSVTPNESSVVVEHNDVIYFWQSLYASNVLTVPDTETVDDRWAGYFSGNESGWDFEGFVSIDSDIDVNLTLPSLSEMSSATLESYYREGSTTPYYRVDTDESYDTEGYKLQRTQVRMIDNSNNIIYQSIYAPVSTSPILLDNSQYVLTLGTVDKIEINLISSSADSDDAVQYLMGQNIDKVTLGDTPDTINDFNDANGFVANGDEWNDLEIAMIESTTLTVKNSITN